VNDNDLKALFAAAVASPAADRIDTDTVLRGGRRRQRIRTGTTAGSALAVLVLAGILGLGGSGQPPAVGGPSPAPSGSATVGGAPVPVMGLPQIHGLWYPTSVEGRGVTGYFVRDRDPVALSVLFGAQGDPSTWELTGWCTQEMGRLAIDDSGRLTSTYDGPLADVSCRAKQDLVVESTISALTSAKSATRMYLRGEPDILTLRDANGNVVAQFTADTAALVETPPDGCLPPTTSGGGSAADKDAVSAAADRVHALADAQPSNNMAGIAVISELRTVLVYWAGPVPRELTDLAEEQARQGVAITYLPAQYSSVQMQAAGRRAMEAALPAEDSASRRLMITQTSGCFNGSGLRVVVSQAGSGAPPPFVPAAYAKAIQEAVGDIPVFVVAGTGVRSLGMVSS
jgi:hypothetical protein